MTPARALHFVGLMLVFSSSCLAGTERENIGTLLAAAEHWLSAQISSESSTDISTEVQANALDNRTQLSKCRQAVLIDFAPGQGLAAKTTLSVRCPDSPGWRLFLPMHVTQRASVWVARHSIANATALQTAQWRRETRDIASLPASAISNDDLTAYQARMPIAAGAVLTQALVTGKTVVIRGQALSLLTKQGSISIRVNVEAMETGAIGQRIKVRNQSSGNVIEALVRNAEEAEILTSNNP